MANQDCTITFELLHELFEYREGQLIRKKTTSPNAKAGNPAGGKDTLGYITVSLRGKRYLAHRLIWLMHYKYLPMFVDHINGDKSDNRIENLREATKAENAHNSAMRKDNTSGAKGVGWHKARNKWRAYLQLNGRYVHLGLFTKISEAKAAVTLARQDLHGEFARHK